jgi:hypothetical protein
MTHAALACIIALSSLPASLPFVRLLLTSPAECARVCDVPSTGRPARTHMNPQNLRKTEHCVPDSIANGVASALAKRSTNDCKSGRSHITSKYTHTHTPRRARAKAPLCYHTARTRRVVLRRRQRADDDTRHRACMPEAARARACVRSAHMCIVITCRVTQHTPVAQQVSETCHAIVRCHQRVPHCRAMMIVLTHSAHQ